MEIFDNYYSLTPETVLEAAEKAGFEPTGHILQLNSLENRVYSLYLEDGTSAVIKFYRPARWTEKQILQEHEFLKDLYDDEIPVCAPIAFNGSTIGTLNGFSFAVWPKTGGRIPDEFSSDDLMKIGRLLGRIHNTGKRKAAPERNRMTSENFIRLPLDYLTQNSHIPQNLIQRFSSASLEIADKYDELSRNIPFHRIHGDCHWGNLLKRDENFFFLDFDDFVTGPAVQDFWMLAPDADSHGITQREYLIEGYMEFAEFDREWLRLIPALKGLRFVNYCAWISKRYDDPAFKHAFPNFGTPGYWEKEVIDLEAIRKEMSEPCDNAAEKLENKDYFYDM